MISMYSGIPNVIFSGNVIARAIGIYNPGLALGAASFIAAGTAIYEALAANMANKNRLPTTSVTDWLIIATMQPLMRGITIAKRKENQPFLKKGNYSA